MSTNTTTDYFQDILDIGIGGLAIFYVVVIFFLQATLFCAFHYLLSFAAWSVCGRRSFVESQELWFWLPAMIATSITMFCAFIVTSGYWSTVQAYRSWYVGVFMVESQTFFAVALFETGCVVVLIVGWYAWTGCLWVKTQTHGFAVSNKVMDQEDDAGEVGDHELEEREESAKAVRAGV
jgi:hypothetical protein